ncbi:MAG: leucyl aminopeptidase family protein [Flavobacteriales bacterium]|nr:leucyl aminopeptidase family protein [Flavobacteriales bacterium]MDW8431891.1 leucyl aminopeptidase family protein [Flavobacteriales bacterium]
MPVKFKSSKDKKGSALIVFASGNMPELPCSEGVKDYIKSRLADSDQRLVCVPTYPGHVLAMALQDAPNPESVEARRQLGSSLLKELRQAGIHSLQVTCPPELEKALTHVLEGLIFSTYEFNIHKNKSGKTSESLIISGLDKKTVRALEALQTSLEKLRHWVNAPFNHLSAQDMAKSAEAFLKESGIQVEVMGRKKIAALRMGGLLGVNQASPREPRFVVAHYKPDRALNKKPVVLVGKGVVFDTGGASLKTATGMMTMKNDMTGAALALSILRLAADLEWPLHLVALAPLTDNMLSPQGLVPGDVITMSDGTTVEVLNTDAEGRLILADALVYARHLNPELVVDVATLTGAVGRALSDVAAGAFEKNAPFYRGLLEEASEESAERIVWFPLWSAYGDSLKSDVADLKNIGGQDAGHITAAKFLEHFTDYPWIHLDIAAVAFAEKAHPYRGKGATGWGLLLLKSFFTRLCQHLQHG